MKVLKYHSCENTFLITNYNKKNDYSAIAKKYCSDTDGLIVFKNDPVEMLYYNKDGTRALMCGNGIRCLMHYLYDTFNIYKYQKIKSGDNYYNCSIISTTPMIISVNLGIGEIVSNLYNKTIKVDKKEYVIHCINLGVNHLVIKSSNLNDDILNVEKLYTNELFNKEYNVNLVHVINQNSFEIITYEKGVGFSKSCGSGAAASAYVLHTEYGLDKNLIAISQGGILKVDIEEEIILTGPTTYISKMEIDL